MYFYEFLIRKSITVFDINQCVNTYKESAILTVIKPYRKDKEE